MPQNSHFSRLARAAARRSSRARDMRNEIMKFNLTSVYIVILRSKVLVNQLQIVIIAAEVFSKEVVNDRGFCSRKLEFSTTSAFFSCGGSKPVNFHFPPCFLKCFLNSSSTSHQHSTIFATVSYHCQQNGDNVSMEVHEDESICQRKQCDVIFSNVVLCVFRRTFFDVTQVFQRHCVEISSCRRFRSRDVEL